MDIQFDLFKQDVNAILDATTYNEFRKLLIQSKCDQCALSKSRTNIVIDRGNPKAHIMAIGEGPGENEDIQGKAFVGRAGMLMDELMKEVGIDTNRDLLIANIVKCRPPENRAPHKEEAKVCFPYLKKQIQLVRPKVILLLGATALKYMVHEKVKISMESEAGKWMDFSEYPGIRFMVLYHPAYLLYDSRKKPVMREHLRELKAFFDANIGKAKS